MATVRRKQTVSQTPEPAMRRPALSNEARENEMIALAIDLAEKQLREGTASSQVITHYLKLGTMRERKEMEKLDKEINLIEAKVGALESVERIEQLYSDAMAAMKDYRVESNDDEEEL